MSSLRALLLVTCLTLLAAACTSSSGTTYDQGTGTSSAPYLETYSSSSLAGSGSLMPVTATGSLRSGVNVNTTTY